MRGDMGVMRGGMGVMRVDMEGYEGGGYGGL